MSGLHIQHHGKLGGKRSVKHANARTQEHMEDQVTQELKRRDSEGLEKLEHERLAIAGALGIGFEQLDTPPLNWDRTGRLIEDEEFERILLEAASKRSRYLAIRSDRPNKARWVEVEKPVEHRALPLSPWATKTLNTAAKSGCDLVPILTRLAKAATNAWEEVTGFEVLVMPLHPKPSLDVSGLPKTTHLQPYYAKVSTDGKLIGTRRGKGKSNKPRFAGPVLLACVRLRQIGLEPDEFGFPGAGVRLDSLLKDRESGGQRCADLATQEAIDEEFNKILDEYPELSKIEKGCRNDYIQWKRAQLRSKEDLLKENHDLAMMGELLKTQLDRTCSKLLERSSRMASSNSFLKDVKERITNILTTENLFAHHIKEVDGRWILSEELLLLLQAGKALAGPTDPFHKSYAEIERYRKLQSQTNQKQEPGLPEKRFQESQQSIKSSNTFPSAVG